MRTAADLPAGLCPSGPHHAVPAPAAGHREQLKASNRPAPLLNISAWKGMGRPMNCGRPLGCWLLCLPGILVLVSSIEADHVLGDVEVFGNVPRCLCPGHNWRALHNRSAVRHSAVRVAAGSSVSPTGSVRRTSGGPCLTSPAVAPSQPRGVASKAAPAPCRRKAAAFVESLASELSTCGYHPSFCPSLMAFR